MDSGVLRTRQKIQAFPVISLASLHVHGCQSRRQVLAIRFPTSTLPGTPQEIDVRSIQIESIVHFFVWRVGLVASDCPHFSDALPLTITVIATACANITAFSLDSIRGVRRPAPSDTGHALVKVSPPVTICFNEVGG
jgi:hypothetical protein